MNTYNPKKYFWITISVTWIAGFIAAFFSYNENLHSLQIPFILIWMFTPVIVAMSMIYGRKSEELKIDFKNRLFNLKLVKSKYWLVIILIMPITLLLATSISLLFSQPIEQFNLSKELINWWDQIIIILIILLLAPTFEELWWRWYGVDSLKKWKSIFIATFIFAILWNIWHWPLFAINWYYQNELIHTHWIYALNFITSIFPAAFLMNWIYYKNNRSIIAVIVFHIMLNLFSVMFETQQFTKCIITLLLSTLCVYVVYNDKDFWFINKNSEK